MTPLHVFRKVAIIEAISYLVLLFVAMPMKYFMDMPLPVKYIGWLHGVLFVAYVICLIMASFSQRWKFIKIGLLFLASLLPFIPFFVDNKLKEEEAVKLKY